MARKRSAAYNKALKTARMWEKRARAKDRRLIDAANLEAYSPTFGASRDLESMNIHELRRYTHEMSTYTAERFVRAQNGELISGREMRRVKSQIKKENARRKKLRESIENVPGAENIPTVNDNLASHLRLDPRTLKPIEGAWGSGSPLEPIRFTERPRTAASFKRIQKSIRNVRSHDNAYLYDRYRRSAEGMAAQTGDAELAKAIRKMSDRQLMFAVERMGLIERLAYIYTPLDDIEAGLRTTEEMFDEAMYGGEVSGLDEFLANALDDYSSIVESIVTDAAYVLANINL